jgi:RimJ/RimL family protein N-acetyltransferase
MNLFKLNAIKKIKREKQRDNTRLKLYEREGVLIHPVSWSDLGDNNLISQLQEWREHNQNAFPSVFKVTYSGTARWLKKEVLEREDRLLFLVRDVYGETVGHVGVSSFDYQHKTCEIDNIVRGKVSLQSNVMRYAMQALLNWIRDNINPEYIRLRVFNDNTKAINLYHKLGFELNSLYPLTKVENNDGYEWVESNIKIERFFISMKLKCVKNNEK